METIDRPAESGSIDTARDLSSAQLPYRQIRRDGQAPE